MNRQPSPLPRWICVASVPYSLATIAAVLAPELLIGGLWLVGIRPEHTGSRYMWPGSWSWGVIWAYSFSLIFGWAFILGLVLRSAALNWFLGARAAAPGWLVVLLCAAIEIAHFRGYVGWVHLLKV